MLSLPQSDQEDVRKSLPGLHICFTPSLNWILLLIGQQDVFLYAYLFHPGIHMPEDNCGSCLKYCKILISTSEFLKIVCVLFKMVSIGKLNELSISHTKKCLFLSCLPCNFSLSSVEHYLANLVLYL